MRTSPLLRSLLKCGGGLVAPRQQRAFHEWATVNPADSKPASVKNLGKAALREVARKTAQMHVCVRSRRPVD